MHEYMQWAIYNAIMFGSIYGFAKLIEYHTWKAIENYEDYEELYKKWIM